MRVCKLACIIVCECVCVCAAQESDCKGLHSNDNRYTDGRHYKSSPGYLLGAYLRSVTSSLVWISWNLGQS